MDNTSSPQPLREQDANVNLNQLLSDTFDKVGKASGAGGLETSKWAVNQKQQRKQPSDGGLWRNGIDQRGITRNRPQQQQPLQPQPKPLCSPHRCENGYSGSREGEGDANHQPGEVASPSFKASLSTRDGDATRILRVTNVEMNVDMASLHALVGQCIDPGLEKIVDAWEVGDTCRTVTLHFNSKDKAMLFSSLLDRLHNWSRYKIGYASECNS
ncbi:hypothetical protein ACJ72_06422 [Emergomyces africanus]|uniref:Uncharacterized protein n=1 Tax=Emergomyces africanus TaxID=1955775 RepID=A0A1B7NRF6_9EURO|nr:hypothetical protein ACJ72_06422 [Emergomyces africanus]